MNYNQIAVKEQKQQLDEWVFLPWLLPALATAARVGGPALFKLLKHGKNAAGKAKVPAGNAATAIVKNPGTTLSWVGGGYVFKSVYDVVEKVKQVVGDFMDDASIEAFAQLVWKHKLPVAAVIAVLYGGKKLKDYMAGEDDKEHTTINNYYGADQQPATESIYARNKENQMDPEVLIQGYGRMQLSQLEAKVVRMFTELAKTAESGNWDSVEHNINKGLIQTMIEAITTTYKELEEIRKRGGTNSRGINKR